MSVKSVSLSSMAGWVVDAFRLLKKNSASLAVASALNIALVAVLCLPMWLYMFRQMSALTNTAGMAGRVPFGGDVAMFYEMYGLTLLVGLFVFPPVLVGWMRLCQGLDQGRAVSALEILKPYQDLPVWFKAIRFALLALVVYLVVLCLFALPFIGVFQDFQHQTMAGTRPGLGFLAIFFVAYFCFLGVAMLLQFGYMLGFTELSLRDTDALEALKLGMTGMLKNLFKLVVFMIAMIIVLFVVMFFVGLVFALLGIVLSMIHPMLSMVMIGIFYLVFLLCLYPLLFSGHYLAWKSVLGDNGVAPPTVPTGSLSA